MEWTRERRIAPAQFLRVKDGDTFMFLVDTSFHSRVEWPFRLEGYDAWEKRDELGPAAITFAEDWFRYHAGHSIYRFPFLILTSRESRLSDFERMTLGRFVGEIRCDLDERYGPMLAAAGMTKG